MAYVLVVMSRYVALSLFAVLAFGCSNNEGLSVRGSVRSLNTGEFNFDTDYRLDSPPEGYGSVFTGECEMAQVLGVDGEPAWGIVATVRRGNDIEDPGLDSVTIMQRTDRALTDAHVDAVFGMTEYSSTGAGGCSVEIPYALPDDGGVVGLTGSCEVINADGNSETLDIALDFTGCDVID